MSLNRKEWEEMWERIKSLEMHKENSAGTCAICVANINWIKEKIQQVIGQME